MIEIKNKLQSDKRLFRLWRIILVPIYILVVIHFAKDITRDLLEIPTFLDKLGNVEENLIHLPEKIIWFYHWAMVNTLFIEMFLLFAIPKSWRNKCFTQIDLIIFVLLFYLLAMFSLATFLDPRYQWVLLGSAKQNTNQKSKRVKNQNEFSILSYNVLGGVYTDKILEKLESVVNKPDIVCFQEFPEDKSLSSKFEQYFGNNYSQEKNLSLISPRRIRGLATFYNNKKFKLQNSKILHLPTPKWTIWEKMFVWSITDGAMAPVDRTALITIFEYNKIPLVVLNTHLAWEGGAKQRLIQLDYILKEIKELDISGKIILCGDFNLLNDKKPFLEKLHQENIYDMTNNLSYSADLASPFSLPEGKTKIFQYLLKSMVGLLEKVGMNTKQKIDYIFAKDVKTTFSEVYENEGSDHYPILVHFVL